MPRLSRLVGVLAFAGGFLVPLVMSQSALAAGYWRYVDSQFRPSEQELQAMAQTPGRVDEKHVSGGFQVRHSGQGSVELFFKNDDVDHHVFQSRMTLTYGASAPMLTLVPGDEIEVKGTVSFKSNFPGASAWGTVAVDNGDYFVNITTANGQASGEGSFKVPNGGPGSTLRYIAGAYISANGAFGETMTNSYEWVEGTPPTSDEPETVAPGPADTGTSFDGDWWTSEGDATLTQTDDAVTGTYSQDNGRIAGKVTGKQLTGYWGEDSSNTKCQVKRLGTFYWGRIAWALTNHDTAFEGEWSYCDGPMAGKWSGARVLNMK